MSAFVLHDPSHAAAWEAAFESPRLEDAVNFAQRFETQISVLGDNGQVAAVIDSDGSIMETFHRVEVPVGLDVWRPVSEHSEHSVAMSEARGMWARFRVVTVTGGKETSTIYETTPNRTPTRTGKAFAL